jgi:DNA topoisomerase-1
VTQNVVVVESPAKAKTINKYLGKDYVVLASYGHIRDLPSKNGSVDPNNNFSMIWGMEGKSLDHVKSIEKALKGAKHLLLATDPDREGEAISWHVEQVLRERGVLNNVDVKRIVFNEITKNAIQGAIKSPRDVNQELVDAYMARRALDYLVGFNLSPVLWRKLPGSRSAGRVQSVALRLIVEREQEIEKFTTTEYWSVAAHFISPQGENFTARLTHYKGEKLDKFSISKETQAKEIVTDLLTHAYQVEAIESKEQKRSPAAPFITSTLQQEASRKLGFGASRTMQVAQRLYEGVDIGGETVGLITYMRTDSVNLSNEAIGQIRGFIEKEYGPKYLPSSPRAYKSKAKNAQEAHEAIRPTNINLKPADVARYLDEAQLKLYTLIWNRSMACQMENALFNQVGVDICDPSKKHAFRATGSTLIFDGFLKVYREGRDEDQAPEDDENYLPPLKQQDNLKTKGIEPSQHFTQPPPRYSEATLVKKLEELGIGRPSTYASLIQTLQDRAYVKLEKRQFIPEDRGRLVTSFLSNFFKKYVEYDFTAHMEEELDEIANGKRSWLDVLQTFWQDFHANVEITEPLRLTEVIDRLEEDLSQFLFQGAPKEERICPQCNTGHLSLKLGKFGAFLGCSNYPDCKYTRQLGSTSDEPGENMVTGPEPHQIGIDPDTQNPISLRKGPYGFYLQWEGEEVSPPPLKEGTKSKKKAAPKPVRAPVPPGVDPQSITLEMALKLKKLPFTIGIHPSDGKPLMVGIGRFGPYIKYEDKFVSIPKSHDLFTLTVDEAVDLIAKKEARAASGNSGNAKRKATGRKWAAKKSAGKNKS